MQVVFRWTEFYPQRGESCDFTRSGSGFIISEDGYVLTAEHVIGAGRVGIADTVRMVNVRAITVITYDGKSLDAVLPEPYPPELGVDIGILKIQNQNNLPYVQIAKVDTLELGDPVIVLGYPEEREKRGITVTQGIINNFWHTREEFRIGAQIGSGASGAPVLNSQGEVIGIATASTPQVERGALRGFYHRAVNLVMRREGIFRFIQKSRSESEGGG